MLGGMVSSLGFRRKTRMGMRIRMGSLKGKGKRVGREGREGREDMEDLENLDAQMGVVMIIIMWKLLMIRIWEIKWSPKMLN